MSASQISPFNKHVVKTTKTKNKPKHMHVHHTCCWL